MEMDNIFKLHVTTLQKLAAISVAVNFWERQDVKNYVKVFFKSKFMSPYKKREQWRDVMIEYVAQQVDSFYLLANKKPLIHEINEHVFTIGGLIFDFIYHVTESGIDINFGLEICWAPYGRIDELKMARRWFNKEPSLRGFSWIASFYTDEELILEHVVDLVEDLLPKNQNDPEMRILNYQSVSYFMFSSCLKRGQKYLFAARYFWNKLSVEEKQKNVRKAAYSVMMQENHSNINGKIHVYIEQKRTELLLFFINEIRKDQRAEFISKYLGKLFDIFLRTWPHQELCLNMIEYNSPLTDYFWDCIQFYCIPVGYSNSNSFADFFVPIIKYKNQNVYHVILRELLSIVSDNKKNDSLLKENSYCFLYLALNLEYVTISIIVNDVYLDEILKPRLIFYEFFKLYDPSGKYEDLCQYLNHLFSNEKEKEKFKENLSKINRLLFDGKFEEADKFLHPDELILCRDTDFYLRRVNSIIDQVDTMHLFKFIMEHRYDLAQKFVVWFYSQDSEMSDSSIVANCQILKSAFHASDTIDPVELCMELINEKKIDTADYYLIWRFESEDERRELKKMVCLRYFLRHKFYAIWYSTEDVLRRDEKCKALLKFFLESDKAVAQFIKYYL